MALERDFLVDGSLSVLNTETLTVNCIKICSPVCCETIADLKVCVPLLKDGVQVGFLSLVNAPKMVLTLHFERLKIVKWVG